MPDEMLLPVILGGLSVILGLVTAILLYKLVIKPSRQSAPNATTGTPAKNQQHAVAPTQERQPSNRKDAKPKKKTEQCLFVVFDEPSHEINAALGALLAERNAFYEADLGAFHLPPGPQGYPLMVANATSPGLLPPIHKEGEHEPVKGISILIRFLNARKVSRHPDDLIAFTHTVADLGASRILDAEQKPITQGKLAEMRREGEVAEQEG